MTDNGGSCIVATDNVMAMRVAAKIESLGRI